MGAGLSLSPPLLHSESSWPCSYVILIGSHYSQQRLWRWDTNLHIRQCSSHTCLCLWAQITFRIPMLMPYFLNIELLAWTNIFCFRLGFFFFCPRFTGVHGCLHVEKGRVKTWIPSVFSHSFFSWWLTVTAPAIAVTKSQIEETLWKHVFLWFPFAWFKNAKSGNHQRRRIISRHTLHVEFGEETITYKTTAKGLCWSTHSRAFEILMRTI